MPEIVLCVEIDRSRRLRGGRRSPAQMTATATTPHPFEARHPFDDAPVIHRYTRADAIRDGMLADVTETAREAGFRIPVAITATVQDQCVRWTEDDAHRKPRVHQDEGGRLWDVLWMAACKARKVARSGRNASSSLFQVIVVPRPGHVRQRLRTLKLVIGPGDAAEPVATIMLPDED